MELKTLENRRRWARALKGRIELSSSKFFLFTPLFFIPFSFRIQFIYNLNLFISFLIIKTKINKVGFNNIVLWLYHPFDYLLLRWFKNRVFSIFDWAEEWAEYFIEFNKRKRDKIRLLEERIIKKTDIVLVVSEALLGVAKKINKNVYHLLDGTVYEFFQTPTNYTPEEMRYIKKPILGYLGTIKEKVDIELLEFISEKFPQASLVFIGDIHYQRVDVSRLNNYKNVYFLGGKKYEELGSYTNYFDICLLPYKPELSVFISPTKIFDYLATGKPVVSTNLPVTARFKDYVYIADSKEEFVELIKMALNERDPQLSNRRLELARENTWSKRASEIMEVIKERINFG